VALSESELSLVDVLVDQPSAGDAALPRRRGRNPPIPSYLSAPYGWAYLNRKNAKLLDHDVVVTAILLGNHRRLRRAVLSEVLPGQSVLQAAHVYGCLIPELARRIGPSGRLDVVDLVPLQAALCRRKLRGFPNARVRVADAAEPGEAVYDVVSSFFLLHEIPDERKRAVLDALLGRVAPGGKAVFVDYHEPAPGHPLRGLYRRLFRRLEPFAESLWHHELREFSRDAESFRWEKKTMFGGVYQRVVAHRV
jgi:SAM-dependent methyltransferase